MPRKEKPPARRSKPAHDSPMYTTSELCARYHCSRRTLRRMTPERGYPNGRKTGKEVCYVKDASHAWERIHMPELWPTPPEPVKTEEDKHWDRLRKRYLLEKEEREANPPPPPKPRRPPRRAAH